MATTNEAFQLSTQAAEFYESKFVPAIFAGWAPHLIDVAGLRPGQRVLDVACGTGVVARAASEAVAPDGSVTGVDLNPAMLAVAQRIRPDLTWQEGDACALPFPDASFDSAVCQASLMFFPDPALALREMARVVIPEGTVAVQVWGTLESSPGYHRFAEVVARHAGPEAVELFGAYWVLGELEDLLATFGRAGLEVATTRTRLGPAVFSSIDDFVTTEVESTPLLERIDADTYARIREDAKAALSDFLTPTGEVAVPMEGHLVAARPRS